MIQRCLTILIAFGALAAPAVCAAPINTEELWWPHRLYLYLGISGYLSFLCWAAAVTLVILHRRRTPRRTPMYAWALLLAVGGFWFGLRASDQASAIEVDHHWEELQRRKIAQAAQREKMEKKVAKEGAQPTGYGVQFAEESVEDRLDVAGKGEEDEDAEKSIYAKAARGELDESEARSGEASEDAPNAEGKAVGESEEPGVEDLEMPEMSDAEKDETYAYRRAGPKKRKEGKQEKAVAEALAETPEEKGQPKAHVLPQTDKILADQIDRWNLFLSKWILVAVMLSLVMSYIAGFNATFNTDFPLPIGGPWIDAFSPKSHSVLVGPQPKEAIGGWLRELVRKGETFVYFGAEDPFSETRLSRLPPVPVSRFKGKLNASWQWVRTKGTALWGKLLSPLQRKKPEWADTLDLCAVRTVRFIARIGLRVPIVLCILLFLAIPVPIFYSIHDPDLYGYAIIALCLLAPLLALDEPLLNGFVDRQHYDGQSRARGADFPYESAWFGRGCFTVTDEKLAQDLLKDLQRFLSERGMPRARALRTVNVVWHYPPPSDDVMRELSRLARLANMRLLFISQEPLGEASHAEGLFDETRKAPLDERRGPPLWQQLPWLKKLKVSG